MKVVLRSDVDGVGKRGDILDVADGYARNFLMPKGLAMRSSAGTERQAEAMRKSREIKDAKDRSEADLMASRLVATPLTIAARASGEGRLFGSVSEADVVAAAGEQASVTLERRWLTIDEPIKELGSHQVTAKPHPDVQFPITVNVISDQA